MSFHKPHTCEHCLMYDQVAGGCKEQASPNWGGRISPFTPACQCYISTIAVYAKKNRTKRWRKVRTLDDMCDPTARLY